MRHGVIAVAVISVLVMSTAHTSYGDTAYGVGKFMNFDGFSGVFSLDTVTAQYNMLIHTPGIRWYGATDGPTADTFFAIGNPKYDPGPAPKAPPTSELFIVDTTVWTVTSVGLIDVPGGSPIREIGWDETTNTLYGTDYANLYQLPTIGGSATFIGRFSPAGTPPANVIDHVFAMDFDPGVGRQVGTSWASGQLATLYSFHMGTGLGTAIGGGGGTTIDRLTDVWHSRTSGTFFGVNSNPGEIFTVNTTTGVATNIGSTPNLSASGMANATPGSPPPAPFVIAPVPLTNLGYATMAFVDLDSYVSAPTGARRRVTDVRYDPSVPGDPTAVNTNAGANVPLFAASSAILTGRVVQTSRGSAEIDLTGPAPSNNLSPGTLRISSKITGQASGTNGGVAGIIRNSNILGNANLHGSIGVGGPPAGESVLFGASVFVEGWISGEHVLFGPGVSIPAGMEPSWSLTIRDNANPTDILVMATNKDALWDFSFVAQTGQILDYEFNFDGLLTNTRTGDYVLYGDVDFAAATPEPATMAILGLGTVSMILRRRRRKA